MTHKLQPRPNDEIEHVIVPLKNSEALIFGPYGSSASQSGSLVEPRENRVIVTTSSIEKKVAKTLLADPAVRIIKEQAARMVHLGDDGKRHTHTIDLIACRHDGENIGYLVKPESTAVKHGLRAFTEKLAAVTPKSVVHRLQPVTDRQLPEWHVRNASLILSARRERRSDIDVALVVLAPKLSGPIRIGDLARMLGGGALAFRPIVRALYYGTLVFMGVGEIDENAKVRFSGQVMEDTDRFGPSADPTMSAPPVIRRRRKEPKPYRRASFSRT